MVQTPLRYRLRCIDQPPGSYLGTHDGEASRQSACRPYTRTTTPRYGHPTLPQSRFEIPPSSNASLCPTYQQQLDSSNNEPFLMLNQERQHPMLTEPRQLRINEDSTTHDGRFPSTIYKERFHFIFKIIIFITLIILTITSIIHLRGLTKSKLIGGPL